MQPFENTLINNSLIMSVNISKRAISVQDIINSEFDCNETATIFGDQTKTFPDYNFIASSVFDKSNLGGHPMQTVFQKHEYWILKKVFCMLIKTTYQLSHDHVWCFTDRNQKDFATLSKYHHSPCYDRVEITLRHNKKTFNLPTSVYTLNDDKCQPVCTTISHMLPLLLYLSVNIDDLITYIVRFKNVSTEVFVVEYKDLLKKFINLF